MAEPQHDVDRIVAFSDAVFAVVLTLLVLPIATGVHLPAGGSLSSEVWALRPRILAFAISFLVAGQFWIAHHRMFEHIRRSDTTMTWLNLVVLLTMTWLPFPSAVLGLRAGDDDHFAVVFFAVSLAATSLALTVLWWHALRAGLVDERDDAAVARSTARSLTTLGTFLAGIGLAFFGLVPALLAWLVLLPAARVAVANLGSAPASHSSKTGVAGPGSVGGTRRAEGDDGG
jgi:uncharacterized membrane protein